MPFVMSDDEELKKQQEAQQQGGQNISGSSTSFNVNVPGQTPVKAGEPKRSGQYQNIQKYLAANQTQGEEMGQKIAQGVESKVSGATQAGQSMQGEIKAPETYDPNKVLSNLGGASEEEKKAYQTTKQTGGYTGPSDLTGTQAYGEFVKKRDAANDTMKNVGTETGQQTLLKETYGRPNYTKGANALDQTLLQQSSGGKAAVEGLGTKYQNLITTLGGFETGTTEAIKKAQEKASQNISGFAPAEKSAKEAIWNPIKQRADAANVEGQKFTGYLDDVSDLNLNPETLAALGLSEGQQVFNTNLGNYITGPLSQATVGNIATESERQGYNQLLDFLGQNTGELGLGSPTYQGGKIDLARLGGDIASQKAEYDSTMGKPASQVIAVNSGSNMGLGLPNAVINAMNTMTLPELAAWVQSNPATGYGGTWGPDSYIGKQIMDQYNALMSQYGANNRVKNTTIVPSRPSV